MLHFNTLSLKENMTMHSHHFGEFTPQVLSKVHKREESALLKVQVLLSSHHLR